jgi:NADPH-dependent glutamate synthase beta subunit-like oxidoreductase/NAD-dependent dihydropyrimidine dehydrogenase PreA subunit
VPRYIRYIREGKFDRALAVIRERIPFPAVCGHACVHPCEAKCARAQYDQPIAIRLLKKAADELGGGLWKDTVTPAAPTGKKVAVVGAGPGGLTAAYYLAGLGHQVTVFEALPEAGGMMRYGIPEYRLPNSVLDRDIAAIKNRGVKIKTGIKIASLDLLGDFDAVFVAVGAWTGSRMDMEGEGSLPVMDGLSFLNDLNAGKTVSPGKKVVIIGGGNTALDCARASVRLGASEVKLVYRRTRNEMPASAEEIAEALEEGVVMEFLAAPVKMDGNGIICTRMELGPKDKTGRPAPVPIAGSEFALQCDTVIAAVGQRADTKALGLEANPGGTVKISPETLATSQKGVFAGGDCVTGPTSIISAIAQGRQAASSIDRFLGGRGEIAESFTDTDDTSLFTPAPMGTNRPVSATSSLGDRLSGFGLAEKGYDRIAAQKEARRCLSCDLREYSVEVDFNGCKACGYCKEVCGLGLFEKSKSFNDRGYQPMEVTRQDKCVGCLKCFFICPDFAISIEKVGGAE